MKGFAVIILSYGKSLNHVAKYFLFLIRLIQLVWFGVSTRTTHEITTMLISCTTHREDQLVLIYLM